MLPQKPDSPEALVMGLFGRRFIQPKLPIRRMPLILNCFDSASFQGAWRDRGALARAERAALAHHRATAVIPAHSDLLADHLSVFLVDGRQSRKIMPMHC